MMSDDGHIVERVNPARAGMILDNDGLLTVAPGKPRASGDDPFLYALLGSHLE